MRLIDADELMKCIPPEDYGSRLAVANAPTVEAVPWEKLERYAEFFCADVPYPEFVREAKLFYLDVERSKYV